MARTADTLASVSTADQQTISRRAVLRGLGILIGASPIWVPELAQATAQLFGPGNKDNSPGTTGTQLKPDRGNSEQERKLIERGDIMAFPNGVRAIFWSELASGAILYRLKTMTHIFGVAGVSRELRTTYRFQSDSERKQWLGEGINGTGGFKEGDSHSEGTNFFLPFTEDEMQTHAARQGQPLPGKEWNLVREMLPQIVYLLDQGDGFEITKGGDIPVGEEPSRHDKSAVPKGVVLPYDYQTMNTEEKVLSLAEKTAAYRYADLYGGQSEPLATRARRIVGNYWRLGEDQVRLEWCPNIKLYSPDDVPPLQPVLGIGSQYEYLKVPFPQPVPCGGVGPVGRTTPREDGLFSLEVVTGWR